MHSKLSQDHMQHLVQNFTNNHGIQQTNCNRINIFLYEKITSEPYQKYPYKHQLGWELPAFITPMHSHYYLFTPTDSALSGVCLKFISIMTTKQPAKHIFIWANIHSDTRSFSLSMGDYSLKISTLQPQLKDLKCKLKRYKMYYNASFFTASVNIKYKTAQTISWNFDFLDFFTYFDLCL